MKRTIGIVLSIIIIIFAIFMIVGSSRNVAKNDLFLFNSDSFYFVDSVKNYVNNMTDIEVIAVMPINNTNPNNLSMYTYSNTNKGKLFLKKYKNILDMKLRKITQDLFDEYNKEYYNYIEYNGRIGFAFSKKGIYYYCEALVNGHQTIIAILYFNDEWHNFYKYE